MLGSPESLSPGTWDSAEFAAAPPFAMSPGKAAPMLSWKFASAKLRASKPARPGDCRNKRWMSPSCSPNSPGLPNKLPAASLAAKETPFPTVPLADRY